MKKFLVYKILFFVFPFLCFWASAKAQLTLLESVDNAAWQSIYGTTNSQRIYASPAGVCASKINTFIESSRKAQAFIRTMPGFVEGFFFERQEGNGPYNFMTTAVWEDEGSFENAKKAVAAEFKQRGFDPNETRKRLNIQNDRGIYERTPY